MTPQTTPAIPAGLIDHPFLRGLDEEHRTLLASVAKPFTAGPGEMLVREGESATSFVLIQSGHVEIGLHTHDRGAVSIQTIGPGEAVGWSWLVPPHRWHFDCRARDEVHGFAIDAAWLRQQCEEDHELGYYLLKQLIDMIAGRLAATRLQLLDLYR